MSYIVGSNTVITATDAASNTFASNGAFASAFYKTSRVLYTMQGESYGYAAIGATPGEGTGPPYTVTTMNSSIDSFPFSVDTNATNIGNMITGKVRSTGHSSVTHGYIAGGIDPAQPAAPSLRIERFPFISSVSSEFVGSLDSAWGGSRTNAMGTSSVYNGYSAQGRETVIRDKFPFASTTFTASVVATAATTRHLGAGVSSFDYGYSAGGLGPPIATIVVVNTIERFPFASDVPGHRSVGTLAITLYNTTGISSYDNGYVIGGISPTINSNDIQRFPFAAATTNAADVGSLVVTLQGASGQSSYVSGYHSGATVATPTNPRTLIAKFPFASSSIADASTVGNLTVQRGASTGHQS